MEQTGTDQDMFQNWQNPRYDSRSSCSTRRAAQLQASWAKKQEQISLIKFVGQSRRYAADIRPGLLALDSSPAFAFHAGPVLC
jgi:hypothetical protein